MNKQKLLNMAKKVMLTLAQLTQRFGRWWWSTFQQKTGRGKAIFGCGSLLGACFFLTMCGVLVAGPSAEVEAALTAEPLLLDEDEELNLLINELDDANEEPPTQPPPTSTNTPLPTNTNTPIPPTDTPIPPTATATATQPPPTNTSTPTSPPPTNTPIPPTSTAVPPTQAPPTEPPPPPPPSNCVDINRASFEDLKRIIHIDDVRANELISRRPFSSVDGLTVIKGIAAGRLADIKAQGLACVVP